MTRRGSAAASTVVVLFNRDLRVHDHPALAAAAAAGFLVPLFVFDPAVLGGPHASPNRVSLLVDALGDLRRSLRQRGGTLVLRHGDPVEECMRVAEATGATAVHVSADISSLAGRRERRLRAACDARGLRLSRFPGVTVVPPGELRASSGNHYRVFTPYWHAWRSHPWRAPAAVPDTLRLPGGLGPVGVIPAPPRLLPGERSPRLIRGGEAAGRARMAGWIGGGVSGYSLTHDGLGDGATSRLGADLHLGCVSPLELARRSAAAPGGEAFVRQLCWRDFHHQVADAFPELPRQDYRPRGRRWSTDPAGLRAWTEGTTGVAIVDAAMRQLRTEGWMPNRARLITATHLVRTMGIDWRLGAAHFIRWLCDGDIASNSGNWQWVAGTGNDTRPNRGFNVDRQAARFDPDGDYVRRWTRG